MYLIGAEDFHFLIGAADFYFHFLIGAADFRKLPLCQGQLTTDKAARYIVNQQSQSFKTAWKLRNAVFNLINFPFFKNFLLQQTEQGQEIISAEKILRPS